MSWLAAIPGVRWAQFALVALVIGLVSTAFAMQWAEIHELKVKLATEQKGRSDDRASYASAAASAAIDRLAETSRRVAAQKENSDEAQRLASRALAAAAARVASADRLLHATQAALAALRGARGGDPGAVPGSPAADPAADLLADVQRRLVEAVGRAGDFADASWRAASQCAADYDALTPAPSITLEKLKLGG